MPNAPVGTAGGFPELRAQLLGRTGITGPARRRALARLTDGWLGELSQEAGINVGGVALVAVGGYGRGELSPFSDLDLVLLHSTETPASYAGMLAERLWYPIWDSKIRLDHSVRSVGGARQIARTDLPAMLGMLDLRHIAGDPELAVTLHRRVLADWRADAKTRLPALLRVLPGAGRRGRASWRSPPRPISRNPAAACATWWSCGPSPRPGWPTARTRAWRRRSSALLDVRDAVQSLAGRATDRLQVQDQDAVAAGARPATTGTRCCVTSPRIARTVGARRRPDLAPGEPRAARLVGPITDVGGRFARPHRAVAAGRRHRRAGRRGRAGPRRSIRPRIRRSRCGPRRPPPRPGCRSRRPP